MMHSAPLPEAMASVSMDESMICEIFVVWLDSQTACPLVEICYVGYDLLTNTRGHAWGLGMEGNLGSCPYRPLPFLLTLHDPHLAWWHLYEAANSVLPSFIYCILELKSTRNILSNG